MYIELNIGIHGYYYRYFSTKSFSKFMEGTGSNLQSSSIYTSEKAGVDSCCQLEVSKTRKLLSTIHMSGLTVLGVLEYTDKYI